MAPVPEGHTIHRAARLQRRRFAGRRLHVWSPQGRFAEGAAALDGTILTTIDAYGKHLFYRWEGALTLHVHLGLFGRFVVGESIVPSSNARMAWEHDSDRLALSGPTVCEIVDPALEERIRERLGPDPLNGAHVDPAVEIGERLSRRSIPIGSALLDQTVMAGVGNVYRAELLFLAGIDPRRTARSLSPEEVAKLWDLSVEMLDRGEKAGRIVTVDPCDVGVARAVDIPPSRRLYAYKRGGESCHRCGTAIQFEDMGGRAIWFCPRCQS